ncbi:TNF receptor-associated factor 2 [Patella vulgata]|uniref:TNF receptor-associated factor 2 n=1 Tax=Patella vulgata TaxID=6465 RepID=UPI0021803B96|nr:TNF receptor-associated factor 2 [Patella vulgata]XP_050389495.1 TNF receptor-associated factor 2 [Patella vulgata]
MAASKAPQPSPEGYNLEIFINKKPDEKFLCNKCELILREPVQSPCGHRYCQSCFKAICGHTDSQITCQACVKEDTVDLDISYLHKDKMYPDMAIKREMGKIQCKCVNQGCSWTGVFKNYMTHEIDCEFRGITCKACGKNIPESKMEDHLKTSCPKRKVRCENCNAEILFSDIKEHKKTCPKVSITCEACNKKLLREQLVKHTNDECSKRIAPCPAGCSDLIRYDQLQTHIQKNVPLHLKYTLEATQQLARKIDERISALAAPASTSLNNEIARLSERIAVIERGGANTNGAAAASGGSFLGDDIGAASRIAATELRVNAFEPIMGVLHKEIEKCNSTIEIVENKMSQESQHRDQYLRKVDELDLRMRNMEKAQEVKDRLSAQNDLRFQSMEFARYDGVLIWKISDFKQKRQDALTGKVTSTYSPTFYTGHVGYKMCARLYPNGDGMGKGTHISLFFVLMRGNYDNLLSWPFKEKVTLMMIDQNFKEHIVDTFRPDPQSSSFRKPQSEMNIASGCPLFLPLSRLQDPQYAYVKDDVMFVKISVEQETDSRLDLKTNNFVSPP